jgi:hypothetical protein
MIVTNVGAGCDGRGGIERRTIPTRTAKPCGPGAPTLASSLVEFIHKATVANKPGHRGERGISRNTIAQGKPECCGEPVVTGSCAFHHLHARLRVHQAPGFPCAL